MNIIVSSAMKTLLKFFNIFLRNEMHDSSVLCNSHGGSYVRSLSRFRYPFSCSHRALHGVTEIVGEGGLFMSASVV